MRIALLQMDVAIGEPERNYEHVAILLDKAASEKPDMIVLPEMWNTGYDLERAQEIADVDGKRTREILSEFARSHGVYIVGGSVLYRDSSTGNISNTMFVMNDRGEEILRYDKLHLFRLMDEDKYLTAGHRFGTFNYNDTTIGVMICYDLRFPQLSRKLVHEGAKVLINCAQWPSARVDHWRALLLARAIENQSYVIGVNRVGVSRGTAFPGNSMVFDPWGEILLEGDGHERVYSVELDLGRVDEIRKKIPVFADQRLELYQL